MKNSTPYLQIQDDSHNACMAKTGEHCPLSGWWAPAAKEGEGRLIVKGNIMPADMGKPVAWILITPER